MLKVVKFGGSSLADADQFQKACDIINEDENRRYIVPSAPGKRFSDDRKVTDMLYESYYLATAGDEASIELFHSLFDQIKNRYQSIIDGLYMNLSLEEEFDTIEADFLSGRGEAYAASRGEYLSGKILASYLNVPFVDAADVVYFHEDGRFDPSLTDEVMSLRLEETYRAVIPGFYGRKPDGSIETFSRGGSDITGSIVARAVHADIYENWTDVSGFLVADPNVVPHPKAIDSITYRELRELSYMGATVLHEAAIFPVREAGIPIQIRNTDRPQDPGTLIVESTKQKPRFVLTGIAGKKDFASVTVEKEMMNSEIGFCRKVLQVFEDNGLSIEHMPSGIDTMSIFVHQEELLAKRTEVIDGIYEAVNPDVVDIKTDQSLIAVVGRGMRENRGTSGRIFSALAHANVNVNMIDQGSSELNIIIGVKNQDFETAIRAIYDIFVTTQL